MSKFGTTYRLKIVTKQIIIFFGSDYSFRSELSTSLGENMESRVVSSGTKGVHIP